MMGSEPIVVSVAAKALDGLSMRMAAFANNLANANSPRFQAIDVDFESALKAAAENGVDAVRSLRLGFEAGRTYAEGEDRRLDLLIADAAQTSMRYAALVDMLGRRLSIHRVLTGGPS